MTQTIDLESELLPSAAVFDRMKLELLDRLDEAAPVPAPAPVDLALRKHRPVRRRVIGASTLIAAAVVATLVATNIAGPHGATAEAAEVLHSAALASIHSTDPVVGPGQYLKVDTTSVQLVFGDHAAYEQPVRGILYVPADRAGEWIDSGQALPAGAQFGDAAAMIKDYWGTPRADGHRVGSVVLHEAMGGDFIQSPQAIAEIAALPTEASTMRTYLYAHVQGQLPKDVAVFEDINELLSLGLVPAKQRAAMFEVLTQVPGVFLSPGQATINGRRGVAISRMDDVDGVIEQLIIDPATGQFIGERDIFTKAAGTVPAGTMSSGTSVTTSVVDSAPSGPFLKEQQPG